MTERPSVAALCKFCGHTTRSRPIAEIETTIGLYLAHLVESHWPELCRLRDQYGRGREGHDAWRRL
jgi:hypothetical protein